MVQQFHTFPAYNNCEIHVGGDGEGFDRRYPDTVIAKGPPSMPISDAAQIGLEPLPSRTSFAYPMSFVIGREGDQLSVVSSKERLPRALCAILGAAAWQMWTSSGQFRYYLLTPPIPPPLSPFIPPLHLGLATVGINSSHFPLGHTKHRGQELIRAVLFRTDVGRGRFYRKALHTSRKETDLEWPRTSYSNKSRWASCRQQKHRSLSEIKYQSSTRGRPLLTWTG